MKRARLMRAVFSWFGVMSRAIISFLVLVGSVVSFSGLKVVGKFPEELRIEARRLLVRTLE